MLYQLEFQVYQQPFHPPLQTRYGIWEKRQGIILCLSQITGALGWGEIAPLPEFGSETLAQAIKYCYQFPTGITESQLLAIPDTLPACQFGFQSAWEDLQQHPQPHRQLCYSGLLPAGETALQAWYPLWQKGDRTFKWKIGVYPVEVELSWVRQLKDKLPADAKLRLDANAGLTWETANQWLSVCDELAIEFLEQPLPVPQFDAMLELSQHYTTPIALDESVATLRQLESCYQQGWRGIFIIKPSIAGSPQRLREFIQKTGIHAVFSSVFETQVGRKAALKLAAELSHPNYAVGFGVNHWLKGENQAILNFRQE